LVGDETIVFFCFKKRRRVSLYAIIRFSGAKAMTKKADLSFMKSIKKKLNVREIHDDPEFAKDDTDYPVYSRESLFLYLYALLIFCFTWKQMVLLMLLPGT
jgi:hypothetical protein